jgi:hypothetical protein
MIRPVPLLDFCKRRSFKKKWRRLPLAIPGEIQKLSVLRKILKRHLVRLML